MLLKMPMKYLKFIWLQVVPQQKSPSRDFIGYLS